MKREYQFTSSSSILRFCDFNTLATAVEWVYGTRKTFPVYGSFTADPGENVLTSM
jgi:hypothetical protein